jgi:5-bromo-4-chloroindolyl phosphate hydrolysis protein
VWLLAVTMLTIGYGDVTAMTVIGRIITMLAGIVGIVVISLLVNAVSNSSRFLEDEVQANEALLEHALLSRKLRLANVTE